MYEGSIPSLGIHEKTAGAKRADGLVAPHSQYSMSSRTDLINFIGR